MNYKSKRWKTLRARILRRDGYQCRECRRYGKAVQADTVHHVYPAALYPGLSWEPWNLVSLYPDGEENPSLWDMDGIPLYKYEGGEVVPRTEEELAADRVALPKPEDKPSSEERIAELEAALAALLGGDANG